MVRCSQDRAKTRYDAECVNARQAVARIQAKEEADDKAEFEARSESKRAALRRTQAAVSEARRRAAEARRQQEETDYLAQFGVLPDGTDANPDPLISGNSPMAVVPDAVVPEADAGAPEQESYVEPPAPGQAEATPAESQSDEAATDLGSIRDELRRRNEEGDGD
jgi:hypothetical protein